MPRTKTGNKKECILAAATTLVAAHGTAVSVRQIAEHAEVGNGTVFLYFANKEILLGELHASLHGRILASVAPAQSAQAALRDRLHACWNGYIDWALAHPLAYRALKRLDDEGLSGSAPAHDDPMFGDAAMLHQLRACDGLRDRPFDYFKAVFRSLAQVAIHFSTADPAGVEKYKASGFDAIWQILTKD
nr:helix-turn-helix domain-containing protein [uncultured Massilia sp.]